MATDHKGGRVADLLRPHDPDKLSKQLEVDYNTVYRWQEGLRLPRRRHLEAISKATGISVDKLIAARRADELARRP